MAKHTVQFGACPAAKEKQGFSHESSEPAISMAMLNRLQSSCSAQKTTMEAETLSIEELFHRPLRSVFDQSCDCSDSTMGNIYSVPLFQRRYCWSQSQWEVLWEDVTNLACDDEVTHSMSRFLLSAGLVPGAEGYQDSYICIDGQQRMTTISIILCALGEHLASASDCDNAKERIVTALWRQTYGEADSVDTVPCRFMPTHFDRNVFVTAVACCCLGKKAAESLQHNSYGDDLSDSPIGMGLTFFREKARGLSHKEAAGLTVAILDRLTVVILLLHDPQHAMKAYESFSRRAVVGSIAFPLGAYRHGERLNASDLIRNLILGSASSDLQGSLYESHWLSLEEKIATSLLGATVVARRLLSDGRHVAKILDKWFEEFVEEGIWMAADEAKSSVNALDALDAATLTYPMFAAGLHQRMSALRETGMTRDEALLQCMADLSQHADTAG